MRKKTYIPIMTIVNLIHLFKMCYVMSVDIFLKSPPNCKFKNKNYEYKH